VHEGHAVSICYATLLAADQLMGKPDSPERGSILWNPDHAMSFSDWAGSSTEVHAG